MRARFLIGLLISLLSWVCLGMYGEAKQWTASLPFLLPPAAVLLCRGARLLQVAILLALLLLLAIDVISLRPILGDEPAAGGHRHRGEVLFLDYMLHLGLAAACALAVALRWSWRGVQPYLDARFSRRPK